MRARIKCLFRSGPVARVRGARRRTAKINASVPVLAALSVLVALSCTSADDAADDERSGAGGSTEAYETDLGTVEISPGSDHVMVDADGFSFQLRYSPPLSGLDPDTALEIVPFPHRNVGTATGSLQAGQASRSVQTVVDQGYSSLSYDEPGSPARLLFQLPDGMEAGDLLTAEYYITPTDLRRSHYTLQGPCTVSFRIRLLSGDAEVLRELPCPGWTFYTDSPYQMDLILPSQAIAGEQVRMLVRMRGWDAPTFSYRGQIALQGEGFEIDAGRTLELVPEDVGVRLVGVTFPEPGIYRLSASADNGFSAQSNPIIVARSHDRPIYWGTLHWHTNYSWDSRNHQPTCMNARQAVLFGRDASLLDFMAVTDHGQHDDTTPDPEADPLAARADMPRQDWEAYQDEILSVAPSEGIIALVGYEHRDYRGDTNMIFRNRGSYFAQNGERLDIHQVWDNAEPGQLLSIPHLHPLGSIDNYLQTSEHERLVEIRSAHGAYEYWLNPQPFPHSKTVEVKHGQPGDRVFVQDLLGIGRRLGFVASDDHVDLPANRGITAVYSPERTRDAIFEALLSRHAYATSSARIILDFAIDSLSMGDEQLVSPSSALADRRTISFRVHGTSTIRNLYIIRNNQVFHEREVGELDLEGSVTDTESLLDVSMHREVGGRRTTYYYLRVVQDDGETAWSSPIFLLLE